MLTSWSRTFSTVWRSAARASLFVRRKSFSSGCFFSAGIPRGFSFPGESSGHVRRVAPQALQAVVAPAFLGEDVDDEVAVVDENPAARRGAFDQKRFDRLL